MTELECEEAVRLWGAQTVPPIFLFLPEAASEAASLLEAAAAEILADEYKDDQAGREVSLANQKAFHERLRASGRFINSFTTLQALRERAIASVANWNIEILERAAAGPQTAVRGIPPAELGAIDRNSQRDGLESVLLAVDESSEPGLCVAIHGPEDAGQFAFLSFLEQWNPWDISGKPPIDHAVARAVRHPTTDGGGAGRYRSATELCDEHITTALRDPSPTMVEAYDQTASAVDFNRIILLPELEPLTKAHVSTWLESVGIKSLKERRRIADCVTIDTAPRAVFDRLNNDGFWPSLTR